MKNVLVLGAFIVMLHVSHSAFAQTSSDFADKFGNPISVFSVSEHILMTPEYAADGQVCRIGVYPKRFAGDISYLGNQLPFDELVSFLNQLAPREARGIKKTPFGVTATGGGTAWTTYSYEKLVMVFRSSFKLDSTPNVIKPYSVSESVVFPTNKPERLVTGDAEFTRSEVFPVELVTITWNDRKCAKRAASGP